MITSASMKRKGKLLHKQENLRAWLSMKTSNATWLEKSQWELVTLALFILSVYHSRVPRMARDTMSSGNKNFSM